MADNMERLKSADIQKLASAVEKSNSDALKVYTEQFKTVFQKLDKQTDAITDLRVETRGLHDKLDVHTVRISKLELGADKHKDGEGCQFVESYKRIQTGLKAAVLLGAVLSIPWVQALVKWITDKVHN